MRSVWLEFRETRFYRRGKVLVEVVGSVVAIIGLAGLSADVGALRNWLAGLDSWIPYAVLYGVLLLVCVGLLVTEAWAIWGSTTSSPEPRVGRSPAPDTAVSDNVPEPSSTREAAPAPKPAPREPPGSQRVARNWRLALPLAAAAGVAIVAVIVLARGDGEGTSARLNPRALAPIYVGAGAGSLAVGEGSVWVANGSEEEITRVALDSEGRPMAPQDISVGALSPGGIAVGEDGVWTTAEHEDRVVRLEVKGRDAEVADEVAVGDSPQGIAIGHGAVWVANLVDGTVTRVAPGGARRTAKVGDSPHDLAVTEDAVWVNSGEGYGKVVALNPETGRPDGRQVPTSGYTGGIAYAHGVLWVAVAVSDEIAIVDPSPPRVVGRIRVGRQPTDVRAGEGGVWVIVGQDHVAAIDPRSRKVVGKVPVAGRPGGLAVGAGRVWVTDIERGELIPIDPRGG